MQKNSNKVVALGTLAVITASTLGSMATPAHSAGWIRRHRGATALAVVGGYLAYRHYKKKHQTHYYRSANRYHSAHRTY